MTHMQFLLSIHQVSTLKAFPNVRHSGIRAIKLWKLHRVKPHGKEEDIVPTRNMKLLASRT